MNLRRVLKWVKNRLENGEEKTNAEIDPYNSATMSKSHPEHC